jgi:hypothetical protein
MYEYDGRMSDEDILDEDENDTLQAAVIKLAQEKPELRKYLIPLLRKGKRIENVT